MNTISTIILIFSIIYFFYFWKTFFGENYSKGLLVFMIVFVISLFILAAIEYDFFNSPNPDTLLSFMPVIFPFVVLGIVVLSTIVIPMFYRDDYHPEFGLASISDTKDWLNLTIQVIGLISSVLGIIAFYLDFLR